MTQERTDEAVVRDALVWRVNIGTLEAGTAALDRLVARNGELEQALEDARKYNDDELAAMKEGEVKTLAQLLLDLGGPEHSVTALAESIRASEERIEKLREALAFLARVARESETHAVWSSTIIDTAAAALAISPEPFPEEAPTL